MNDEIFNSTSQANNENEVNITIVIEELKESFNKYKNSYNKKEIIRAIIENEEINKLLLILAEKNYMEIVNYIIDNFSYQNNNITDINKNSKLKTNDFSELYFHSCSKDKYSTVETLINNDCINLLETKDNEGNTGLILTSIFSNIQIAKLLLKHCSELLEIKNKAGIDALTISVYNNDNLMFFLIANNLTYSIFNMNELCKLAIRNENFEILEYITANKTYIDDPHLLHHACAQKSITIFNHVLNLTKKYDERDVNSETPLHWAVMRASYHIVENLLKKLKENHIEVDMKTKFGLTPFHFALLKQDKNIVRLLYENGANVNELDSEGNSIIHMTSAIGELKWTKHIIKHFNANAFQKNLKGNTPFMVAIINGRYDIVEYFVNKMPSLNWKNKQGQTALHAAVFANQIKILELLLKNKADIGQKDINDLTPYHYAYAEKKAEVIKVIHSILNVDKK